MDSVGGANDAFVMGRMTSGLLGCIIAQKPETEKVAHAQTTQTSSGCIIGQDALLDTTPGAVNIYTYRRLGSTIRSDGLMDHELECRPYSPTKIVVSKQKFDEVCNEVASIQSALPGILKPELIDQIKSLAHTKAELCNATRELACARKEVQKWKVKYETCVNDFRRQKERNFSVVQETEQLSAQLCQQSEFCSQLGSSLGDILWRVSKTESVIPTILLGPKSDEFLKLTAVTLETYVSTFKDDMPDNESEDTQFIHALTGIIANIGVSATGREFLMACEQGKMIADAMIKCLSEAPNTRACVTFKNLLLMALFNMSINHRGLRYLSNKTGIVGLLVWLIQDQKEPVNRLHALKLVQSLVCDSGNQTILSEARQVMSLGFLKELSQDNDDDIQEIALEMTSDLSFLFNEQ